MTCRLATTSRRRLGSVCTSAVVGLAALGAHAQAPIQVGFLWHMHQPIYYPGESIIQTQQAGRYSFSLYDVHNQRFGPYTSWPRNAMNSGSVLPNLGASVSFSGSLIENLNNLRNAGVNGGMWNNWQQPYIDARNLRTARNNPRLDLIGFTYHHALGPLMDQRDLRMQIRMHRQAIQQTFGTNTPLSRGFFPAETAFSTRMIPALVAEGYQWTLYDNIHVDRATRNYPHVDASGILRPNRADQINPDPTTTGGAWVQLNHLWAPSRVSAPNGYRPALAQHIDPATGQATRIVAVPAARYEGNEDGRGGFGAFLYQQVMDQYRQYNTDPARPMLVVLHHDGDNFGGGSEAYYNSNFNNMVNWAQNSPNYNITTIQDYLDRFPVPQNSLVHIAPGSWAGADAGDPEFKKWLGDPNPAGWSPDRNSWAVLTAAKNRVYTAEDLVGPANPANVIANTGTAAEQAWHYLTQAQGSDHWYWDGTEIWDSNVTRGANLAVARANQALTAQALANERTPPSVFLPQRENYNPGEIEFGTTRKPADFEVWTFAYDVSGLQSVTLKYRVDADGENPLASTQNETYAGGTEVGAWQSLAMSSSDMNPQNGVLTPSVRALRYGAMIAGQRNLLLDYYVEAVDARGNITRSDIQHVWVGPGADSPPPPPPPTGGFTMDGVLDPGTTLLDQNSGVPLRVKLFDGKLYLATVDAGEGSDHFIFLARQPGAMTNSPWAKAGQVAQWDAFLADENSNDFEGWFDATPDSAAATGPNGGVLEGWIDLASEFTEIPGEVFLAVGLFANPDGGALLNTHQVPAARTLNGNIEADEYLRFTLPVFEWVDTSVTAGPKLWSQINSWTHNTSPNSRFLTARLGTLSPNTTVTLDRNTRLNRLELAGTGYVLIPAPPGAPPATLTFAGPNPGAIDVQAGAHTIAVPVLLERNAEVHVAPAASLRLTAGLLAPGQSLTKLGTGTFEVATLRAGGLDIVGGRTRLTSVTEISRLGTLSIDTGATLDARLDLGGSTLIVNDVVQFDSLRQVVRTGDITSARLDSSTGIALVRASEVFASLPASLDGEPIVTDTLILRLTLLGDTNIDRTVNFPDLLTLARNYNTPGTWADGDSNGDGQVGFPDLLALARNYNATLTVGQLLLLDDIAGDTFTADLAHAATLIPEPDVLGGVLGIAALLTRRRRSGM